MRFCGGLVWAFLLFAVPALTAQENSVPSVPDQALSRAEDFISGGDFERAYLLLERYHPANKKNARLYQLLKSAYFGIKDYEKLDNLIAEQLALFPKNKDFHLDRVEFFLRQGFSEKADLAAKSYFDVAANDSLSYQNLAGCYLGAGYAEEAVGLYLKGRKVLGRPNLFSGTLAETYRALRRWREALEEYLRLLEADPDNRSVLPRITSLTADIPPGDESLGPFLENLLKKKPNALTYRLKGDWELKRGNLDEAILAYQEADRRGAANGVLLLELAKKLLATHPERVAALAAAYEKSYPKSPELPQIGFFLGQAQTELGDFEAARLTYGEIFSSPLPEDRDEAAFRTARLFLDYLARPDSALCYLRIIRAGSSPPFREPATLLEARALAAQNKFEEAQKVLSRANLQNPPWPEEKEFLLAEWDFYFLDFDQTEKKYTALLDRFPRGERANDALRRLALFKLAGGENSPLSVFAAALKDLAQFKEGPALEKMQALGPAAPAFAAEAFYCWGLYLTSRKRTAEAIAAFEGIKTDHPQTLQASLSLEKLGDLAQKKEPERAKNYYGELLENYPEAINSDTVRGKLRRLTERFPVKNP